MTDKLFMVFTVISGMDYWILVFAHLKTLYSKTFTHWNKNRVKLIALGSTELGYNVALYTVQCIPFLIWLALYQMCCFIYEGK